MNHWKWDIVRWETHCETVEDFFSNPYILRILRKWYREKYKEDLKKGEKLPIWINRKVKQEDRLFTQEFLNFVKNIFQDEQDVEEFFSFVRSEYYDDIIKRDKITYEYHPGKITSAILAMREVMQQLWYHNAAGLNVSTETIKGIMQTRIAWVIEKAFENTPSANHSYNTFVSISSILERWYSPFSLSGEVLAFQGDTDDGIMVSTFKSDEAFEIHWLESMDEIVISRWELIERIRYINRILESLIPESRIVLNQKEHDFCTDLSYQFQEEGKKGSFINFLEDVKSKMLRAIPNLQAEDTTMQKPLQEAGLVSILWHPVLRDAGEIYEWASKPPDVRGASLKVIKST